MKVIVTGGEPTLYPGFLELAEAITSHHRLDFDTNLSKDRGWIEDFVRRIRPPKTYLGISFHPAFARPDEFAAKARMIRDAGFDYQVHLVCHPPLLREIPRHLDFLERQGLKVMAYPFRGTYDGRRYPQGYSQEEKTAVLGLAGGLEKKFGDWVESQIDPVRPYGKPCRAGQRYAYVDNAGRVWRCNQYMMNGAEPLGSILDGSFDLRADALPCGSRECGCESRWLEACG